MWSSALRVSGPPRPRWRKGRGHRHYIHRMHLSAHAAGNICTVVNLGLATAESVWQGSAVGKPIYINPKLIFKTLSPSMYPISMGRVKSAPKSSLDRWGCGCKISSRSVQVFGFPIAASTYQQTNKHLYAHISDKGNIEKQESKKCYNNSSFLVKHVKLNVIGNFSQSVIIVNNLH